MFEFLWKAKVAHSQSSAGNPATQPDSMERSSAPGTRLHFEPNLVSQLLADHRTLLGIFGDIVVAMKLKDMGLVKDKLDKFGDELNSHLLKENVRFYVYLEHSLKNDPESAAIMLGFRKEMQQIGKVVVEFLHKYTTEGAWDEAMWQGFEQEISGIGKVLTKRIQKEESTLYPLYLPQQDYR